MNHNLYDPSIQNDVFEYLKAGGVEFPATVIVGASGMLGSYIANFVGQVNQELGVNQRPLAVVRKPDRYLDHLNSCGIVNTGLFSSIKPALEGKDSPLIIHAASPASITAHQASSKDLIQANILYTSKLCEILVGTRGHLSFLSSGEVYGPSAPIPTKESDFSVYDHLSLRGAYPEAKKAGELIAKTWSMSETFGATALRIYHTFGPGMRLADDRIFTTAVKAILQNENIVLNSPGDATRSFLYTKDLVTAIQSARTITSFETFNVASDHEISILEFAKLAANISQNISVEVPTLINEEVLTRRSPIMRGAADTSKLKSLGWKTSVNIEESIKRTLVSLQWRKSHGF